MEERIILQNRRFRLTFGSDACAESLVLLETGEECLSGLKIPAFSVTQTRPFNNEIKLAHLNKRTTCGAKSLRYEDGKLIAAFELAPYEAVIAVDCREDYMVFTLDSFRVPDWGYEGLSMDSPPVAELRMMCLPVRERESFGDWLNVAFDESGAVNLLATSPEARIDSEKRVDSRISDETRLMSADAVRGIKLIGCQCALIACKTEHLLDIIDRFECDFSLPRGVAARRNPLMNSSIYWANNMSPETLDMHIDYAKKGGFKLILLYHSSLYYAKGFSLCGDCDYLPCYPDGAASVKAMLDRLKAEGFKVGFHFLHTHIGLNTRYVSPHADHRLNLTDKFTLARPLGLDDDILYVEENPEFTVMHEKCRILRFGGELIGYDSYVTERPYRFVGLHRGAHSTEPTEHPLGEIGGVLDISEFSAQSVYLDQNGDLQDEIAEKLAGAYNSGFEFAYFDGSEGTNPPYEYHVPNAQYRVWKRFTPEPFLGEGAARAHFSWHMLSGGNAFDTFKMNVFKQKIDEFPAEEAPRMRNDFTRVNFGWWLFDSNTEPDIYEYGTSHAAGFDCPATLIANPYEFEHNLLTDDILEVLRRWEIARSENLLTDEDKAALRTSGREFTLLREPDGSLKLHECRKIAAPEGVTAFSIDGEPTVSLWNRLGEVTLRLAIEPAKLDARLETTGESVAVVQDGDRSLIRIGRRTTVRAKLTSDELIRAIADAKIID